MFPTASKLRIRLPSGGSHSDEQLRFLQDRIALFGKVIFVLSAGFLVIAGSVWAYLDLAQAHHHQWLGRGLHLLGALASAVVWLVARQKRLLSARTLRALDVWSILFAAVPYGAMGYVWLDHGGVTAALLAIVHVTIGRAVLVPSTGRRTLVLSLVAFTPVFVLRGLAAPEFAHVRPMIDRAAGLVELGLWTAVAVTVATVASNVIYGLRREVRQAKQLGQYTLQRKIGQGGMGVVYRASHALLRRPTAVKLLASKDVTEGQRRRFEREVQLTSMLTHPNTISIYDYGRTPGGVFYYAMEFLDGVDLERLVAETGPLPPERVIHILKQVCGALGEAHAVRLIHRDVKPANILICDRGGIADMVKVLDFGLVKEIRSDVPVTQSAVNSIAGTPLYMSPEAILTPDELDGRSDLYALGAVAYYLLTATPVFLANNVVEICSHHLQTVPELPSVRLGRPLPEDLETVVMQCLAKSPDQRPRSAEDLLERLEHCRDANAWTARRAREWWRARGVPRPDPPTDSASSRLTLDVNLDDRVLPT